MSKHPSDEVLPANLEEHRAVKAWRQLQPYGSEPQTIEVLKFKRKKSAVYRLTGVSENGSTLIAKRCPTGTASTERVIYESFLPRLSLPALNCYGFVTEPDSEFCWLFLEDAGAHEYSLADAEHRALAGRWLGTIHCASLDSELQAALPDHGPGHYLNLLHSTRSELLARVGNPVLSGEEVAMLRTIAANYDVVETHWAEVEQFCAGLPRTLVHGDFVIKNLRLQSGANGPALLVFDWEMAGWGVPATDLAQIGRCASPDLDAYCSVVRQHFSQLDHRRIRRLADYGDLLRVMDVIFWETVTMKGDAYKYLLKPLRTIEKYAPQLVAVLRALNWS